MEHKTRRPAWGVTTGMSLASSVFALLSPASTLADPITIGSSTNGPVTTAQASNGSQGDVTISSGVTVTDANAEPVVTVNSSNSLTNSGTITSTAASGATGVLIDGTTPVNTTVATSGVVSVTGAGGSGNYGLRVANGPVSGTIIGASGSTISVVGDNSIGASFESAFTGNVTLSGVSVTGVNSTAVSVTAPLTGNLALIGATTAGNTGGIGVGVFAPVSGSVGNSGTITGGVATSAANPLGASAGLSIGASVAGGVVNDRYYVDSTGARVATGASTSGDTLVSGTITASAGSSAVLIQPQASAAQNIELGHYGATGSGDEYGLVNRAIITATGQLAGSSRITVLISGATLNGVAYMTTLDGGLVNQANGSIAGGAIDATSTAIAVGAGATVPTIINLGTITSATTSSAVGGSSQAIVIQPGGSVSSLTNSGAINATAVGGYGGYAILDQAGTLGTVANSGTITAKAASGQIARAIDVSASGSAVTVTNTGTITGDVAFGGGASAYVSTAGALNGALLYGSGAGVLRLSGTAASTGAISVANGGTLAVSLAGASALHVTGAAPTISSFAASDSSVLTLDVSSTATPLLTVAGTASFSGSSQVKLNITQPVTSGTLVIISAAGGITSDHGSPVSTVTGAPFLLQLGTPTLSGGLLEATISEKTPAQLGFGPGFAPLVTASYAALNKADALFQAFINLPDQASVQAAYNRLAPPSYGSGLLRIAQNVQGAMDDAIDARFATLRAPHDAAGAMDVSRLGLWIQQAISFPNQRTESDNPGFNDFGYTLAGGADYALARGLFIGAAISGSFNNLTPDLARSDNDGLSVTSTIGDLYLLWTKGPFFADAIGSVGHDDYGWTRAFTVGSLSDTLTAHWSGTQYSGEGLVGVRLRAGRFYVEPSDAVSFGALKQGAYALTGSGDLDLNIYANRTRLATNAARVSVGYTIGAGDSAILLALRGAYLSELDHVTPSVTASFADTGAPFTISSAPLANSQAQLGASATFTAGSFAVRVAADRRQESQGYADTGASVTVRLRL